jgi:hypothetical protein
LRALVCVRDADGRLGIRNAIDLEGPDAKIGIPEPGVVLPFSDRY